MVVNKLEESIKLLNTAIAELKKNPENKVIFAGVVKCFEICFEYIWKAFKREASNAGYEVYNPRDSIKAAAEIGLISDLESWKRFLNARNLSVHDYVGIPDETMEEAIKDFQKELKKINMKKLFGED